jgi:DNA-binding NarL/FixJ family response regulator
VIADDVADLRFLLTRALESTGRFTVVAQAANGQEAVEQATAHKPDLTLLDLGMPVLNGLDALPLIREAVPDGTVVVVSGYEPADMEAAALARGAAGYLVKGVGPRQLVGELLQLLEDLAHRDSAIGTVAADGALPSDLDRANITLPASLTSGKAARMFVADRLGAWKLDHLLDTTLLLTTELVTNAVVHAGSPVSVTVRRALDRLRVEVADMGGGALTLREVDQDSVGGRGLMLIEALSTAWGTSAFETGKLVWFELPSSTAVA